MAASWRAALDAFIRLTNKGTRAGHPYDYQRWAAFIVDGHLEGAELTPHELEEELLREYFSAEVSDDLATRYERARALLREYDRRRADSGP